MRVRCVASVLLLLLSVALYGATPTGSTRPPRDLHLVGDHWTPYNPPDPSTFAPGSKVHTIVAGDTLWGLAQTYYSNPYLWPQLWEANTYITDAHWIYPGDPLLVQGETTTGEVATTETTATATTSAEGESAFAAEVSPADVGTPIALGQAADIYCFGYIGDPAEPMANRVSGFDDVATKYIELAAAQDIGVADGEIIHIEGGLDTGLVAGEEYIVVNRQDIVLHPATDEPIGRYNEYRGRVRILCATGDRSTAIVTQSCSDIRINDRLKPVPEIPVPLARLTAMANVCTPPNGKVNGYIVSAKDAEAVIGEGTLVQLDLGRDDFIEPGDFLTVYREHNIDGVRRQVLGEVGVLTSEGSTSTGRIIRMRYEMRVGDQVELK